MRWDRQQFPAFLARLVQAGGYPSETQLASALGEQQGTVWGWRRAKRRPARLEAFLRRFASKHGYDTEALVERWELVASAVSVGRQGAAPFPAGKKAPAPPRAVRDLMVLIEPQAALDPLAGIDAGYRHRFEQQARRGERRLVEYAQYLQRELVAYRDALVRESQGGPKAEPPWKE